MVNNDALMHRHTLAILEKNNPYLLEVKALEKKHYQKQINNKKKINLYLRAKERDIIQKDKVL
jgi:hypothetical protein